jgi:hypothetical protein
MTFKPYQLVTVDAGEYKYVGQIISNPFEDRVMVRRVPDDPATMEEMTLSSLKPTDRKYKWVSYASVMGKGQFPVDMLRYDMAAPVNFKLVEDRWGGLTRPELTTDEYGHELIVATVSETKSRDWTQGRWNSFLWSCKPLKTLRIEGRA